MTGDIRPHRIVDEGGASVDVFSLPTDAASLEELLRDLFQNHWRHITFGPIIQGAAWDMRGAQAPDTIKMFDGYLTVAFGVPHFHLCIGEHKGPHDNPVSPALARDRRTARAELFRQLSRAGHPISWGLRLFNGEDEQQITVLLPNPFLHPDSEKILKTPDWSRLERWHRLRARWLGLAPTPSTAPAAAFATNRGDPRNGIFPLLAARCRDLRVQDAVGRWIFGRALASHRAVRGAMHLFAKPHAHLAAAMPVMAPVHADELESAFDANVAASGGPAITLGASGIA